MSQQPTSPPSGTSSPAQPVFGWRLAIGLFGILLAAMTAGLNNRVPGLAQMDIQGALGFSSDGASWLSTAYAAGELAAMPFATWCAITFSLRRMHTTVLTATLVLALLMPFIRQLDLLIALRALQGLCAGTMIPVLMMAMLRFLPPAIRLHGLAFFTMTATFAPNVAFGITALVVDHVSDWRWVYWQVIPPGLLALALVNLGIPPMPAALSRLKQANWFGLALGIPGLALLVVTLDQGLRLDWFHSPVIVASAISALTLITLFLVSEWFHPAPFMRLQILERRNLYIGFFILVCLLITLSTAIGLPANLMIQLHDFRMAQIAPMGLMLGLPQLVLGSLVALLLYQRWVNACYLLALGLLCIAAACWFCSNVTSEWQVEQFVPAIVLQAIGQPMAIVSLLFLCTSVVAPMEGAFVSGLVNTLRGAGVVAGGAIVSQLMFLRGQFHQEMLLDQAGRLSTALPPMPQPSSWLLAVVPQQASVMAGADIYRIFGSVAMLLIPLALLMQRIPAPDTRPATSNHLPATSGR